MLLADCFLLVFLCVSSVEIAGDTIAENLCRSVGCECRACVARNDDALVYRVGCTVLVLLCWSLKFNCTSSLSGYPSRDCFFLCVARNDDALVYHVGFTVLVLRCGSLKIMCTPSLSGYPSLDFFFVGDNKWCCPVDAHPKVLFCATPGRAPIA